jgi:cardiolipin synthase
MPEVFWLRSLSLSILHLAAAATVTVHVALYKRNVRSATGWIGLAWLAPLVGPFLYLLFGINRVGRSGSSLGLGSIGYDKQPLDEGQTPHSGFRGMHRLAGLVVNRPLLAGNKVEPLVNGDEAYPAMLTAIREARESITMTSYIFDYDDAGRAFLNALSAAFLRGVQVRVLIDAVGAHYSHVNMIRALREAGVPAATFLPTHGKRILRYANLRNHRKIMVVDGVTGFTGGMNIRAGNMLQTNPPEPVQDLHFRVSGPIIADFQRDFAADWNIAAGELLSGSMWFKEIPADGPVFARGIPDGPDSDMDNMQMIMLGALAAAQLRARIVTPYFLPDDALLAALKTAALRGVMVDIVLPERSNLFYMDWAMHPQLADLLDRGCRIFLSPRPFDHTKIFTVDGLWSLIGSTNWDARSLRLNFEYNIECYDIDLAATLEAMVDKRIAMGHAVSAEDMRSMPVGIRIRDGLARMFSPYL